MERVGEARENDSSSIFETRTNIESSVMAQSFLTTKTHSVFFASLVMDLCYELLRDENDDRIVIDLREGVIRLVCYYYTTALVQLHRICTSERQQAQLSPSVLLSVKQIVDLEVVKIISSLSLDYLQSMVTK